MRSSRKEEEQRLQEEDIKDREDEEEQRRGSFPDLEEEDFLPPMRNFGNMEGEFKKPQLTCISEEEIADIHLGEKLLEELENMENITSCNKVENYLMLSVYEQNLIKVGCRAEQLLQAHILIGQEVQLPSSDWTRVTELSLLFIHNTSFQ